MTSPVDIVKQMDEAFRNKDEALLRQTLHPDYTLFPPDFLAQVAAATKPKVIV